MSQTKLANGVRDFGVFASGLEVVSEVVGDESGRRACFLVEEHCFPEWALVQSGQPRAEPQPGCRGIRSIYDIGSRRGFPVFFLLDGRALGAGHLAHQ